MRNTVQRAAVLFFGVVLAISCFAPLASAGSADVGIEPAYPQADNERTQSIFIMQIKPEEQGKEGIHLVNSGKEAHTVEIYPTDSSSSVDGSFSCRQHAEPLKDVGTWVKLDKTKLTLQAGEQTVIDFTVTVPKGTGPGEHDGCVAVQDVANLPAKSGSGVLLGFRSAIRLSVTVPGKIVKKLDILRVEVKHIEKRGVSVSPVAKNSGNVSLDVTARAQMVSIFGQETEIKSGAKYPIMQGATTGWAYAFDGPYWGGIYKARTSLSYNANPNSGIGQDVSSQQRIRKDSGWFVVYPSPLAAIAELLLLVALLWLVSAPLRRQLQRRRVAKHWQKYMIAEGDTLQTIAKAYGIKWKKLAKRNHIKPPYLIETGHSMFVPAPQPTRKTRKPRKTATPELDWLSNEEKIEQTEVETIEKPEVVPSHREVSSPARDEWYSPQVESPTPTRPVSEQRVSTSNASSNPLFPEPDAGVVPDWREGASEEELRQFGVIADSSSVSPIHSSWSIDEEDVEKKTTKKRTAKKRSTSATKTKLSKKSTEKTSKGKK